MNDRYDDKGLIHDSERLKELQALPLEQKIGKTVARLTEFISHFGEDGVYLSVSGGKDSTVLWDIVHRLFPNVPAVFSDTGLEYPEVREFAKSIATEVVKPKLNFVEVIREYGYPVISKEVSGAVYYARRNNRSQAVNVERERERVIGKETLWKRMELAGNRSTATRKEFYQTGGIFNSANVAPPIQ